MPESTKRGAVRLPGGTTGHRDTFARDRLPSRELWPDMDYSVLPGLAYPDRLNCATELLDRRVAAGDGDRIAIRFDGGEWSYRTLLERSNRIARALVEDLGLVTGNRVLLHGPNNAMMAACWFGILKAGGIVVATMPLLRARELARLCEKAHIRLALSDARLAAEAEGARERCSELARVVAFNTSGDEGSLERLMEGKPDAWMDADTSADDVAIIAFTSGTTGEPKGTVHFHRDILAICDCFPPHVLGASRDDIFCGSPPLAFTFGLGGLLLFPLRIGATALLLEKASPAELLDGIERHRATVCFTAPTAYRAIAAQLEGRDIACLRKCVSAGETLPAAILEQWERATGIRIIDGIGSTEMLHIFISAPESEVRAGSTGRAVPGYEARIIDEAGRPAPPGIIGRLAVRGPTGCRYLEDEERQRTYVHDGWNLTGDAYRMDDDGYFWYQARTDDMIVSAGYNIAGPEVEAVLLEHACVQECAVVGLPDEQRGHVVSAFIVLRAGHLAGDHLVKELQDFVKNAIAPYKYPRRVRFVDALPRTSTGKVQRYRLRDEGQG